MYLTIGVNSHFATKGPNLPQPLPTSRDIQPIAMQRFFTFEGLWIVISTSSKDSFTWKWPDPEFRISEIWCADFGLTLTFCVANTKIECLPQKKTRTWKYIGKFWIDAGVKQIMNNCYCREILNWSWKLWTTATATKELEDGPVAQSEVEDFPMEKEKNS